MNLIDGHCHLANLNVLMPVEPLLDEAREAGITGWLSSALTRDEARWYQEHPRPDLRFSAGIHPNYEDCDLDLDTIAGLAAKRQIWAVGEVGLDHGNSDFEWQSTMLREQLEIAAQHQLPVVLHLIGYQQQAYEILKQYPLKYLVHSYAGSVEGFRLLGRLDCAFTISVRLLKPDKLALLREIVAHGSYLFETDITRHYVHESEPNPLLRLLGCFRLAAELLGIERERLLEAQSATYRYLTEGDGV